MTVAVIGGGASGMMAALTAARAGARVTLLERQVRVGRKLGVTGNGRCNLTHRGAPEGRYHGEDASFAQPALAAFGSERAVAFFRSLGLVTVTEPSGRVYPLSDQAGSVVDVLRFALDAAGVETRCACSVLEARRTGAGFLLRWEGGDMTARRLVVACGGAAGTAVGGSADGVRLLERFGHGSTPLRPSLVQLRTSSPLMRSLKGVRADAAVRVTRNGALLAESQGEVQFTEYGLSGPAVFEVSREARPGTEITLDLLRDLTREETAALLLRRAADCPALSLRDAFTGILQNRLGRVVLRSAGFGENDPICALTPAVAAALAAEAKALRQQVTGDQGFAGAQVTAGGAATAAFDPVTMESRLVPGLFACGEVLDIDGDCGGYNLQWAWASGFAAGSAAAG